MIMSDPLVYLPILLFGAFAAAFVIGAVGFADALILNAVWLHIMEPVAAIPLVVMCGVIMHLTPLYKLRRNLDFSRLLPFLLSGLVSVPIGIWALEFASAQLFRSAIAVLLVAYGLWMLIRPNSSIGERGGRIADGAVGLGGGFMGGFAGLSGLLPTLWVGMRGWKKDMQRGVFQPFVLAMHIFGLIVFFSKGMVSSQVLLDFVWCLPVIVLGSWLGVKVYPFVDEKLFKRIVLALILLSGVALLL